jgi:hypothetical protein
MLEPTHFGFDRKVVWSHPAFADQCAFGAQGVAGSPWFG